MKHTTKITLDEVDLKNAIAEWCKYNLPARSKMIDFVINTTDLTHDNIIIATFETETIKHDSK